MPAKFIRKQGHIRIYRSRRGEKFQARFYVNERRELVATLRRSRHSTEGNPKWAVWNAIENDQTTYTASLEKTEKMLINHLERENWNTQGAVLERQSNIKLKTDTEQDRKIEDWAHERYNRRTGNTEQFKKYKATYSKYDPFDDSRWD